MYLLTVKFPLFQRRARYVKICIQARKINAFSNVNRIRNQLKWFIYTKQLKTTYEYFRSGMLSSFRSAYSKAILENFQPFSQSGPDYPWLDLIIILLFFPLWVYRTVFEFSSRVTWSALSERPTVTNGVRSTTKVVSNRRKLIEWEKKKSKSFPRRFQTSIHYPRYRESLFP